MTPVAWSPSYRIISSLLPRIALFEDVAAPEDVQENLELEALTNDRIRDQVGELQLVPDEDRVHGPGVTPIMAAFTHINPAGSRFSDGTYGVYYAARSLNTAVAETVFGRERFLRATNQPPTDLDMRICCARISATLEDIRDQPASSPLYDRDSYAKSAKFGAQVRGGGGDGIVYNSVRHSGGENVAVFRPRLISDCYTNGYLGYRWDGTRVIDVFNKSTLWESYPF